MQLFSLPTLFLTSKEEVEHSASSSSSCSSDESDSRFMNEHDTSFEELHPHQRVLHQTLSTSIVGKQSFPPPHIQSKGLDEVSQVSFESSAISGNSSSVDLNSYGTNTAPSHLQIAMRWRQNMILLKEHEGKGLTGVGVSKQKVNPQEDKGPTPQSHIMDDNVQTRLLVQHHGGVIDSSQQKFFSTDGSVKKRGEKKLQSYKNMNQRLSATASNIEVDEESYLSLQEQLPEPPKLIKKKYSGSQFQISPPITMRKPLTDYPLSEARGRFSTNTSPAKDNMKKSDVRLVLGSARDTDGIEKGSSAGHNQESIESRRQILTQWPTEIDDHDQVFSTPRSRERSAFDATKRSAFSSPHHSSKLGSTPSTRDSSPEYSVAKENLFVNRNLSRSRTDSTLLENSVLDDQDQQYISSCAFSSSSSESGILSYASEDSTEYRARHNTSRRSPCLFLNDFSNSQKDPFCNDKASFLERLTDLKGSRATGIDSIVDECQQIDFQGTVKKGLELRKKCTRKNSTRKEVAGVEMAKLRVVEDSVDPKFLTPEKKATDFERRTKQFLKQMWSPENEQWENVSDDDESINSPSLDKTQQEDEEIPHPDQQKKNQYKLQDDMNSMIIIPTELINEDEDPDVAQIVRQNAKPTQSKESEFSSASLAYSMSSALAMLLSQDQDLQENDNPLPEYKHPQEKENPLSEYKHKQEIENPLTAPITLHRNRKSTPPKSKAIIKPGTSGFKAIKKNITEAAVTNCRLLAEYETKSTFHYSEQLYFNIAATIIQSNYRGMQGRYEVMKMVSAI